MASHKSVGVGVPDDPLFQHKLTSVGANRVSPHLYLYFFIGRENPSPTDTNPFDSKMAMLALANHRFAQIKLTPTIKKFWGYRGIFQNPPKSFLNYLLPDKSQFIKFYA